MNAKNSQGMTPSKGEFAKADRERKESLLFPKELRRLEDGVQVTDRVLLLPDRPLPVKIDDRGKEVFDGHVRFEGWPHGLFRGRRLVPEARLEGREHRGSIPALRFTEPQEIRIPEPGRERANQLPGKPRILRGSEESTREPRRVHLGQGVAEEARLRARCNEQRPVRLIRSSFEREGLEDRLDAIELPFLEERGQGGCVGLAAGWRREGRNLDWRDSLQGHGLHISEVRERHEAARKTEDQRDVRITDREREVVTESSEVVQGRADCQMRRGVNPMVERDACQQGGRLWTHALEHELPVRARLILLGRGGDRPGGYLDLRRCERPLRETEIVEYEEP